MSAVDQIVLALTEGLDDDFDIKDLAQPGEYGEILDLIRDGILDLSMGVSRGSSRYVHERSTEINYETRWSWPTDVDMRDIDDPDITAELERRGEIELRVEATVEKVYNDLKERMVSWNRKIYSEIEAEWDSRLEDSYIVGEIEANEWLFDEDGIIADEGLPFEQLSPELKAKAVESVRQSTYEDSDTSFAECATAEWKWLLANVGFDNVEINFSGFSSQGDGASFTGRIDDWYKFFTGPDPLDFPEQEREQFCEAMEDDDLTGVTNTTKPWGYVLKSKSFSVYSDKKYPTPYPWFNQRYSDAFGCCGNFRKNLGDATVFKRFSTTKQWPDMEAVPIYADPRQYGERVLDPDWQPPISRPGTPMRPPPVEERYGGAAKERSIWYHGTSAKLIPTILAQGLIPDPKKRVWAEDPNTSILTSTRKTLFGIGVTQNFGSASLDGSHPARRDKANTAFVVMELQPRSLIADEDDVSAWVKNIGGPVSDSVYHHIWPYFMEIYRERYQGYKIAEAMEDDDISSPELTSRITDDHYTQAADKQKQEWVDNATKMLFFKFPEGGHAPQLEARVRQLLWDEGYAAMLTRAVSYASKSPHDQMKWESEWGDWFSAFDTPTIPDPKQAEHNWLLFVERLSRTLKNYTRGAKRKKDWAFDVSGRATEGIGFSGANRIVCVIEQVSEREPTFHSRMLVHYGKPPEKLIKDWTEHTAPLGPGDIIYKNQVQEALDDDDVRDLTEPPRIYVRWVWSHDSEDQIPRLYQGEKYKHSHQEHGPFVSYEHAYEWARSYLHDCRDKVDCLDLIQLTDKDTIVNAYIITGDWEMKRYGDLPDGSNSIYKESLEDDDFKDIRGPGQRWLYLISRGEHSPRSWWIDYYATDDPDFQIPMRGSEVDWPKLNAARIKNTVKLAGAQAAPRNTKEADLHLLAQAQVRQFHKTGDYIPGQYANVWDWMRQMRAKPDTTKP